MLLIVATEYLVLSTWYLIVGANLARRQRNPHLRVVQPSKAVLRVHELTHTIDLVDGSNISS